MIRPGSLTRLADGVRIGTVTLNAAIDKRYVVETLRPGHVMRVSDCVYSAGGKGLNVARVARVAGAQVLATGFLGGHAGEFIADQLANDSIAHDFVRVAGESRSCVNIYDQTTGETSELLEPGIEVQGDDLALLSETYRSVLDQVDVVVISGSAPRGCPLDVYVPLINAARHAGKRLLLDTSGTLLAQAVTEGPSLIKPNLDEARGLLGPSGDGDPVRLGRALVSQGVERVVLSRGAQGAYLITADVVLEAVAPRIDAVNTVGCGDAMVAALAIGLAAGVDPADLLTLAVGVGTAAAMTPGTGSFRPTDLDDLLARGIAVREIT